MGNVYGRAFHPDTTPGPNCVPSFDPLFGAPDRKERVMKATKEELVSAKIALNERDYCADKLLQYRACRADVFPFLYKCHHERHAYMECEYQDYVLRMKEFEREKRLLERRKRLNAIS